MNTSPLPPLRPPPKHHTFSPTQFWKPITPTPTTKPNPVIIIHRTHPLTWILAFACLLFSILLILFAISTLALFLALSPRHPTFDTPAANLTALFIDSPSILNADFSFLANFTNPNPRLDLQFRSVQFRLSFRGREISRVQAVKGFMLRRRGGAMVGVVRMVSSLVILPVDVAVAMQREVVGNRVEYEVSGRFRVKAKVGGFGFSYWLKSRCLLQLSAPPGGVLLARNCSTET